MRPFSYGVRLAKSDLPQSGTVRSHLPAFGPSYILSNDRHLFNYNCARRLLSNGTSGMTPDVAFSRYKEQVDLAEKQKAEAERKEREVRKKAPTEPSCEPFSRIKLCCIREIAYSILHTPY